MCLFFIKLLIMEEIWKTIPGYTDYEVSNLGRIRSKERKKKYKSGRELNFKSKIKQQRPHPVNNFIMTDLVDDKGKRRTVYPHKAVALAFVENEKPRKKKVVIHKDGNLKNNNSENLKWATFSESIKIGFETGKRDNSDLWKKRREKYGPMGGTKPNGRPDPLTKEQKHEIYRLRKEEGLKLQDLANKFGCSTSHVFKTIQKLDKSKSKT
jgi:hypothetical protein